MEQIELDKTRCFFILKEEGITVKEMPQRLQDNIGIFKAHVARYNKKMSERYYESLTKMDVMLADAVLNVVEKDLPSEEEYQQMQELNQQQLNMSKIDDKTPEQIEAEKKLADDKAAADKLESDRIEAEKKLADDKAAADKLEEEKRLADEAQVTALQDAIKAKIAANDRGLISIADLTGILGRKPNPSETIGNMYLRKKYKADYYGM